MRCGRSRAAGIDLGAIAGDAYYTVEPNGFRLVATLAQGDTGTPVRFEALLLPGQSVVLSSPHEAGIAADAVEIVRRRRRAARERAVGHELSDPLASGPDLRHQCLRPERNVSRVRASLPARHGRGEGLNDGRRPRLSSGPEIARRQRLRPLSIERRRIGRGRRASRSGRSPARAATSEADRRPSRAGSRMALGMA